MVTLRDKNMTINVLTNNWDASPSRIGFGVAGLIDASLTPPHRMKEKRDPAPEITERVKSFFSSFLSGGEVSNLVTPELATHLFPTPKSPAGTPSPVQNISFIGDSDVSGKGIVRHGVVIPAMRHYKAAIMGDNRFFTVYFSRDGKIADYSGY